MLPTSPKRIWLYHPPADMRKQFDGLAVLIQTQWPTHAQSGDWFVFINRRRTQIKVLYYQSGGYCLWSKRLERGTFHQVADSADRGLSLAQLQCLIEGLYWQKKQQKRHP